MAIARTVETCLERHYLPYAVISHTRATSSRAAARAATVPPHCIAKAVVLGDGNGVLMAVIPGDSTVDIDAVSRQIGRRLRLVREIRLTELFDDCEPGAIPPVGPAYGIETIVDDRLMDLKEICFVAGDRGTLLCVKRDVFLMLLEDARHGPISRRSAHADGGPGELNLRRWHLPFADLHAPHAPLRAGIAAWHSSLGVEKEEPADAHGGGTRG